MPTLTGRPEEEDTPVERFKTLRTVARTVTGTTITPRLAAFLVLGVIGSSTAPDPWAQIGLLGLLGIALEVAHARRTQ